MNNEQLYKDFEALNKEASLTRVDTKYSQIHSSVQFQRYPIMTLL